MRKRRKKRENGGVVQQKTREAAEREARYAAQTGDKYDELVAAGIRYESKEDWRKAAKAYREAIALKPDEPAAYANLGNALRSSGHEVEAAQRYLEAKALYTVGSEHWARATAVAFNVLSLDQCGEVAKPEWWNDEGLKALSARVVRAIPNDLIANTMRALVLFGQGVTWEAGPRLSAELKEAAPHFERAAALCALHRCCVPSSFATLAGAVTRQQPCRLRVHSACPPELLPQAVSFSHIQISVEALI